MKRTKDVPRGRLFRISAVLFLSFFVTCPAPAEPPSACRGKKYDAYIHIDYVIDGDTVVTTQGKHVRLIGIDTPEIGHGGSVSEPGAGAARNYLLRLVRHTDAAYPVVYDREKLDRHGRTLAHLFLPDGGNIQALILAGGYATPLTIPPNLLYHDCYQASAAQAYQRQTGLWSLAQYQPVDVGSLSGDERGYHLVRGFVTRIGESRLSVWINLGPDFAARIGRKDLVYFPELNLAALTGKQILVRGKIYRRNRQLRIYLHHISDIRILSD